MNTFLMLVTAIVVAQFIVGVMGITLVFNDAFTKWYAKKMKKMMNKIAEEMVDMVEKDEL